MIATLDFTFHVLSFPVFNPFFFVQNVDREWVPWSKPVVVPPPVRNTRTQGSFGTAGFQLGFNDPVSKERASPWHDVPILARFGQGTFNFIVEIPMYQV